MKQISLDTTGLEHKTERIRKRELLDEMNLVVSQSELVVLIVPHARRVAPKEGVPRLP